MCSQAINICNHVQNIRYKRNRLVLYQFFSCWDGYIDFQKKWTFFLWKVSDKSWVWKYAWLGLKFVRELTKKSKNMNKNSSIFCQSNITQRSLYYKKKTLSQEDITNEIHFHVNANSNINPVSTVYIQNNYIQ